MKLKRVIINRQYTYETDLPVKVNDRVLLPTASWLRDVAGQTWQGAVTSLESDHTGECECALQIIK
jgi:hypothetical protein